MNPGRRTLTMRIHETRRVSCPLCGGEIVVSRLFQYSHDYKINKSGQLSKAYTVSNIGPEDTAIAGCACGASWDCDEFRITSDGYFIDCKYKI